MPVEWPWSVAVVAVVAVLVWLVDRRRPDLVRDVVEAARRRWVWGLPLGSIVVILMNIVAYLTLQRGLWHYGDPLALPYYSWSFRYPLGVLTSPLTHAGPGHLGGNLASAAVVLPAVEYVIGHRDARVPLRRAVLVFPATLYAVGVVVSILSWGPVIGFSGVLFVTVGFLLVVSPAAAVVALLGGRMVGVVASAIASPVVLESASTEFVRPWWANVAVESHALGLMLGVAAGVLFVRRRRRAVDGIHTGVAFLVVAVMQSLWAVWMTTDGGFVLYRAGGVALVAGGAVLLGALVEIESTAEPLVTQERIELARAVVLVGFVAPILAFAGVAVAVNATGVVDTGPTADVQVRDYRIGYGEGVPNGWMAAVPFLDWTGADANASGVIVQSQRREIWIEQVAADELRQRGTASFHVGGPTWERRITAERRGMESVTGNETYAVAVSDGTERRWVFDGPTASTATRVGRWRVRLEQRGPESVVVLDDGDRVRRVWLRDRPTSTGGVTVTRRDGRIRVTASNASAVVGHVT